MKNLNILSGGAAQGLVASLASAFKSKTGFDIAGEYGAVGAMADKLRQGLHPGLPTDIIILTAALVAKLADEKLVVTGSIADVGLVETAVAVRAGDPTVDVGDAASLRAALLAADAIFVPDTKASTAGIHIAKVLDQLGIAVDVAERLKIYPNGATAMRHLAASDAARPIGCTQSTEIIATEGIVLSGPLPPGCELKTMYTAGVTAQARNAAAAQALIELLVSPDARDLRGRAGFVNGS
jgi:molybdate transport system substrate-binding protein